MKMLKRSFVSE